MAKYALDTPPSSDVEATPNLPPTPPISTKRASLSEVDRLIRHLRLRRRGRGGPESDWLVFRLTESDFGEFERRLRVDPGLRGWFEDRVNYDWEPERRKLVLRMPSAVHERLITCVEDEIVAGIDGLASRLEKSADGQDRKIACELRKVYKGRSTTLELKVPKLEHGSSQESERGSDGGDEKVVRRSPDATFYHASQPHLPMLVVEVAHSQQQKDLPVLAESYIIDSSHAVQAVVGLKIPYLPSTKQAQSKMDKSAWISIWRPDIEDMYSKHGEHEHVEEIGICSQDLNESFRSEGAVGVTKLELRLADFIPRDLLPVEASVSGDYALSIPLDSTVAILDQAEADMSQPSNHTPKNTLQGPTKFRKRKRTPSEELSDGREEAFARREALELEKDDVADAEYIDSARRVRRRKSAQQANSSAETEDVAVRSSTRPATRGSATPG